MYDVNASFIVLTRPQLKHLAEHITPSYASQWKTLGILLGLPTGILLSIEHDYRNYCSEACNQMLIEWLEITTEANWQKIFKVIDSPAISAYVCGVIVP